jgi:hypothetical protein
MSITALETSGASEPKVSDEKSGRDRRQHGRWNIAGGYVKVGNIRFSLVDISMGGFQMRGDNRTVSGAGVFEGSIIWPDGGRHGTIDFKARAVRIEPEHELIGSAFEPMDGKQIDQLLGMLTTVEGKWRSERERSDRAEVRRRLIRRLVTSLSVIGIVGAIGWAVWLLEPVLF